MVTYPVFRWGGGVISGHPLQARDARLPGPAFPRDRTFFKRSGFSTTRLSSCGRGLNCFLFNQFFRTVRWEPHAGTGPAVVGIAPGDDTSVLASGMTSHGVPLRQSQFE